MRIPLSTPTPATSVSHYAVATFSSADDGSGPQLREWSSIVGIVTAIVGNVLISFALNVQRYAHLRLEKEHNDNRPSSKAKCSPKSREYGTAQQERVAEERARLNATAHGPGKEVKGQPADSDTDETHPFKSSYDSEATLTESEKDDGEDEDGRKSYLKSPYWWAGIILMTVGEAGNFLAYGFAPASIVSPLGVVALVSNCVIAPFMLKERFRQRDFWGVVVAIGGVVTVVLSAKQSETKMGPDELWATIKRWEFLVYVGITLVAIIALTLASPKYGSRTILVNLGLVALFGGYTALSTKGVASLLSDALLRAFTFPIMYFLILILVLSAVMQIRYLNKALQNFDSTQVIPTQFVLFTLSVIIGSAVLYRDFESTTADRAGKFIGGCLLTFFGVYLITSGRRQDEDEDEGNEGSTHDETIRLIDEEVGYNDGRISLRRGHSSTQDSARPITPDRDLSRRASKASSSLPSIAVTPDPAASSTSLRLPSQETPSIPSTDHLGKDPQSHSHPDLFKTPQFGRHSSTPFFTPHTHLAPPSLLRRTDTSPADPETPTKAGKRGVSPPKADPALRPPPTPHSLARSARGSIGLLLPGPLMGPLSSSLSGIVADSLLRGEGSPGRMRGSLRRNRSSRTGTNASTAGAVRHQSVEIDGEMSRVDTRQTEPDIAEIVEEDPEDLGKQTSRLRAVSESLGVFMGGRWGKTRDDQARDGEDQSDGDGGGAGGRSGTAGTSAEAPT